MKNEKVTIDSLIEGRLAELQATELPNSARALLDSEILSGVKSLISRRVTPKLLGKMVALGLSGREKHIGHEEITTGK